MLEQFIKKTILFLIILSLAVPDAHCQEKKSSFLNKFDGIKSFISSLNKKKDDKKKSSSKKDSDKSSSKNESELPVEITIKAELLDIVTKVKRSKKEGAEQKEVFNTDIKAKVEGGRVYGVYIPDSKGSSQRHITNVDTFYKGEMMSITGTYYPEYKQIFVESPAHKIVRERTMVNIEGNIINIDDDMLAYRGSRILSVLDESSTKHQVLVVHPQAGVVPDDGIENGLEIGNWIELEGLVTLINGLKYISPEKLKKIPPKTKQD